MYLFFADIVIPLSCLLFYIISILLSTFLVYIHAAALIAKSKKQDEDITETPTEEPDEIEEINNEPYEESEDLDEDEGFTMQM